MRCSRNTVRGGYQDDTLKNLNVGITLPTKKIFYSLILTTCFCILINFLFLFSDYTFIRLGNSLQILFHVINIITSVSFMYFFLLNFKKCLLL